MNRTRLKGQLTTDEGRVLHAYEDSEGYLTVGVGRLIDERRGGGLSEDEVDYLLENDIDKVVNQVLREFSWYMDLNDVRQEVVINMVFNLGLGNFKEFKKTIAAIAKHDFLTASQEMLASKWSAQVGVRATRLSDAMLSGEWT